MFWMMFWIFYTQPVEVLVEGRGVLEHPPHGRDAAESVAPGAEVLVELPGESEHVAHTRDTVDAPVAERLVEGRGNDEHIHHIRDLGDVPAVERLVELRRKFIGRGTLPHDLHSLGREPEPCAEHLRRVAVESRPPDHGHETRSRVPQEERRVADRLPAGLHEGVAAGAPLHVGSWTVSPPAGR